MAVFTHEIGFSTKGEVEIVDITGEVQDAVRRSKMVSGIVCAHVPGATGAITTIEYEDGLLADFPAALERLFPKNMEYQHHLRWHDGNGHSHVRASMLGPSLSVPFTKGKLILGTWQQIIFVELDNTPRDRKIVVQVVGE